MRTPLIVMLLLVGRLAHAADTILTAGDPTAARDLVAQRARVDPAGAAVRGLDQILTGMVRPTLLPQGAVELCQGVALGMSSFREAIGEAEGDILYMEYPKAVERLARLARVLPCLDGVPERSDLARLWFLAGFADGMLGQEEAARAAFSQALAVIPDLQWDADFPTAPRSLLEEQRAATGARARLSILPPAEGRVVVDGSPVESFDEPLLLSPGAHLVQVDRGTVSSFRVQLEPERSHQLAVPGALGSGALAWALLPDRRPDLAEVLAGAMPAGARIFVVHDGQVVQGTLGGDWAMLQPRWIDPEERNAQLREATRALRVSTAVEFYSSDLRLWVTGPGLARTPLTPGQAVLLPLGDGVIDASWAGLDRHFPFTVPESPAVVAALQGHSTGGTGDLVVPGPKLPLPWALEVKVGEETVLRELQPGTKSDAFVSLDLPLPVSGSPSVHVSGNVLGVQGTVRSLALDPGRHPALPLYDAVAAAKAIKRKDLWIAPTSATLGVGLGVWSGLAWRSATRLAAEAKAMDADPELIEDYNAKVEDATRAQWTSWATGAGAVLGLGVGVGYELTFGSRKRHKVAAAKTAWRAATAEPVGLDALTVDWQ